MPSHDHDPGPVSAAASPLPDGIDRCEAEAIHLSGAIQPHCALLCLDGDGTRVVAASANASAMLGCDVRGARLRDVLPDPVCENLASHIDDGQLDLSGLEFDLDAHDFPPLGANIFAHRRNGVILVEIEPLGPLDRPQSGDLTWVNGAIMALGDTSPPP